MAIEEGRGKTTVHAAARFRIYVAISTRLVIYTSYNPLQGAACALRRVLALRGASRARLKMEKNTKKTVFLIQIEMRNLENFIKKSL